MANGKKIFKILALDGGGIRGIYPAHILMRIQEEFQLTFSEKFDLIVGTSTGSILAAGCALDLDFKEIESLYENEGKKIFESRFLGYKGFLASKYKKNHLRKLSKEIFGEKLLKDAKSRLVLTSTDISNGSVYVFKSPYLKDFVRDNNVKIAEAVLASCSAPGFFDPEKVGDYLLADGGLWANNPSMLGITEALSKLKIPLEKISLLSIGTGFSKKSYPLSKSSRGWWGYLTGWKNLRLIEFIFNLQSSSGHNMSELLLSKDNYLRINFEDNNSLRLDDVGLVDELKSKADKDFTYSSASIKKFLSI